MKDYGEPWHTFIGPDEDFYLNDNAGDEIASCDFADAKNIEQLKRAESCVNACSGLNPEGIPELVAAVADVLSQFGDRQEMSWSELRMDRAFVKVKEGRG